MKQVLVTGWLLLLITTFPACTKEKDDEMTLTPKELLTLSGWIHIRSTSVINGIEGEPAYNSFAPCKKDNEHTFTNGGTFIITEGATRCEPTLPTIINVANWRLESNDEVLALDYPLPVGTDRWDIAKLTRDTLIIKQVHGTAKYSNIYIH